MVCRIEARDWRARGRGHYRSRCCGNSCGRRRLGYSLPVMRKLDDMGQCWEITQLEVLIARNVVRCSDGGEHLCLFDGVDAEVRFQIEIKVEHVLWIACFLGYDLQHFVLNGVVRDRWGCDSCCWLGSGWFNSRWGGRSLASQIR